MTPRIGTSSTGTPRVMRRRPVAWLILLATLLVGAACSPTADDGAGDLPTAAVDAAGAGGDPAADPSAADPSAEATDAGADQSAGGAATAPEPPAGGTGGPALADLITELPPAPTGLPVPPPAGPAPAALTIEALGIERAPIIGVGVEDNGDMEIPPADRIGWYRYGPSPGDDGSAVLAAHIAYDGVDGVFVDLVDLAAGSTIDVHYDDGTTTRFVARSTEQYDKDELPRDRVWGRSGPASLVLITCGGDFNRSLRSYDDNIVVYATADDAVGA